MRIRSLAAAGIAVAVVSLTVGPGMAMAVAPTISSVSPNNGPATGGTSVAIKGTGFIAGTEILFGIRSAEVTISSSGSITAVSPALTYEEKPRLVPITAHNVNGTSAETPHDQFGYDQEPQGPWLGLDGNSDGSWAGPLGEFTAENITLDRGGAPGIDWEAGERVEEAGKLTEGGKALAKSVEAGMTPDIAIEYKGYTGEFKSDPNFPSSEAAINGYVEGFVASASEIHSKYPFAVFEAMNEPWGYTTPQYNGAEYAKVIAALLPSASAVGIPLEEIYVGGYGADKNEKGEWVAAGWIPSMYAAKPALETEVQGWYFHPYGPPKGTEFNNSEGIESLPEVQKLMTSGQNNIVVTEIGYCARDVNEGHECGENSWDVANSTTAAADLNETLSRALAYHEAGWLRAVVVYARTAGGYAMEVPTSKLTKQGEALDAYGIAHGAPTWRHAFGVRAVDMATSLDAVSCVFPQTCVAAGGETITIPILKKTTHYYYLMGWNGFEWSNLEIEEGSAGANLTGVACSAASLCTTVGNPGPVAFRWNGTALTSETLAIPAGAISESLTSVSCPGVESCFAAGSFVNSANVTVPLVERWNGATWSVQEPPAPSGASTSQLNGVSCFSSSSCVAVGSYTASSGTGLPLGEKWNGTSWALTEPKAVSGAKSTALAGVACTGSETCVAVGASISSAGSEGPVAESYSGGVWMLQEPRTPAGATATTLKAVGCSAATACTAVGSYTNGKSLTLGERWNGTEWTLQATPNFEATSHVLRGVSCTSFGNGFCAGVGVASLSEMATTYG